MELDLLKAEAESLNVIKPISMEQADQLRKKLKLETLPVSPLPIIEKSKNQVQDNQLDYLQLAYAALK